MDRRDIENTKLFFSEYLSFREKVHRPKRVLITHKDRVMKKRRPVVISVLLSLLKPTSYIKIIPQKSQEEKRFSQERHKKNL